MSPRMSDVLVNAENNTMPRVGSFRDAKSKVQSFHTELSKAEDASRSQETPINVTNVRELSGRMAGEPPSSRSRAVGVGTGKTGRKKLHNATAAARLPISPAPQNSTRNSPEPSFSNSFGLRDGNPPEQRLPDTVPQDQRLLVSVASSADAFTQQVIQEATGTISTRKGANEDVGAVSKTTVADAESLQTSSKILVRPSDSDSPRTPDLDEGGDEHNPDVAVDGCTAGPISTNNSFLKNSTAAVATGVCIASNLSESQAESVKARAKAAIEHPLEQVVPSVTATPSAAREQTRTSVSSAAHSTSRAVSTEHSRESWQCLSPTAQPSAMEKNTNEQGKGESTGKAREKIVTDSVPPVPQSPSAPESQSQTSLDSTRSIVFLASGLTGQVTDSGTHAAPVDPAPSRTPSSKGHLETISDLAAQSTELPRMQPARLVTRGGQTELQVGVQAGDFGNVGIRTSMVRNQITAEITVERGDLKSLLASGLPDLEKKVTGTQGVATNIILTGTAGQGSDQPRQSQRDASQAIHRAAIKADSPDEEVEAIAVMGVALAEGQVDVQM